MHGNGSKGRIVPTSCREPSGRRDQAAQLRRLAARRRSAAMIVAIVSGKGGVGKSNIAANLSICLSGYGLRTTLIDVDLGLANADLLLNLQPRYTLAHLASGTRSIEEVTMNGPGGIRFVPGGSGTHGIADLSEFERHRLVMQLRKLEHSTEIIVLDCGAGVSKNVTAFALSADRVVVVTTPEPTAVTDAYATIKALCRGGCEGDIGLFVNMANSRAEASDTFRRVRGVARKFLDYLIADCGYMLHDTSVELAVKARCPFVIREPGSNASVCIAAMAEELARTCTGRRNRGGFLKRVAGLFV